MLFDIEPWGEERAEYLHGFQTAAILRDGSAPAKHMIFVHPPKPQMTGEEIMNVIKCIPGVEITYG